jgi:hypothetical protein
MSSPLANQVGSTHGTTNPSAVELELLKAQVQDVARVCNAVASGDLSKVITTPAQGVVMVQTKEVVNTMVARYSNQFLTGLSQLILPFHRLQVKISSS